MYLHWCRTGLPTPVPFERPSRKPPDILNTTVTVETPPVTNAISEPTALPAVELPAVHLQVADAIPTTKINTDLLSPSDGRRISSPHLSPETTSNAYKPLESTLPDTPMGAVPTLLRTPTPASKTSSSPMHRILYTASSSTTPLSPKPFGRLLLIPQDQEGLHYFDRGPPCSCAGGTTGLAPARAMPRRRRPPDRHAMQMTPIMA